jgi:endonuclease YncB( thermonuclease family)
MRYLIFVAGVVVGAVGLWSGQKLWQALNPAVFVAVDGDTVRVNHLRVFNQTIRAAGYDTPEIRRANKPKE